MSPELLLKIQEWRAKVRDNTITKAELTEAIAALRQGRAAVPQASAGSRATRTAKAAAAKPNGDDLLSQLEGL